VADCRRARLYARSPQKNASKTIALAMTTMKNAADPICIKCATAIMVNTHIIRTTRDTVRSDLRGVVTVIKKIASKILRMNKKESTL